MTDWIALTRMCSHYQAPNEQDRYRRFFSVEPSAEHNMEFMRRYGMIDGLLIESIVEKGASVQEHDRV